MKFVQAKHFYRGRRQSIKRIYIHSMEAFEGPKTAENVANYFRTTPKKASAHICVDNNSEVQCVKDEDTAFHVGNDNSGSLGLELAGYAKQTREEWLDIYGIAMLHRAAVIVAAWCRKHNVPPVWLDIVDLKENQRGISSHYNGARAFGGSTHWDPGFGFPIDIFMGLVQREMNITDGEDYLTSEEAETRLANIELRLIDLQNFVNGKDDRVKRLIIDPITTHAGEAKTALAGLIRRSLDIPKDGNDDGAFINWLRSKLP